MPQKRARRLAAVFAIGFLMRPIGGWLFGRIADRLGRKTSLMISVLMMCGGSLAIALLPTYIMWAPNAIWKTFDLFVGLIQAFIFALLSGIYIGTAAQEHH